MNYWEIKSPMIVRYDHGALLLIVAAVSAFASLASFAPTVGVVWEHL